MKGRITGLLSVALLVGGAGQANAGFVQLLTPAALNPGDTTATYPGNDGDSFASGSNVAAGGNTLTFSNAAPQAFTRVDQGNSWQGAYPNGTKLLWNLNPNTGQTGGAVTISFATGVSEVGLSVQQDDTSAGTTTFSFQGFGTGTSPIFTVLTSNTAGGAAGVLSFLGIQGTGGDLITSLVISSTDTNPGFTNDFVLGPVTFGATTGVPEPSTFALSGIVGVAGLVYWRKRRAAKPVA